MHIAYPPMNEMRREGKLEKVDDNLYLRLTSCMPVSSVRRTIDELTPMLANAWCRHAIALMMVHACQRPR